MQRATLDLWVGLFVVAGIAAVLFLALKVGNLGGYDSSETYLVKASFDNIGGLKPRAPVKECRGRGGAGCRNRIRPQNLRSDCNAFRFGSVIPSRSDSSASIMTSGLLGEQYIALEAGGDEKMLVEQRCAEDYAGRRGTGKSDWTVSLQQERKRNADRIGE
jgi:phospholipid/cholesterol/gamma-HCH transport system substrate-binding protein